MTCKTKVPTRSHDEATVESFRKNPKSATAYLNAVLDDGDQQELMLALRHLSEARRVHVEITGLQKRPS